MKKLIIIGAGFGGLRLARKLNNHPGFDILLIDKANHHQFQPLFYQVATGGLDASNISFPLRKIFHHSRNVTIRLAEVLEIQPEQNQILTTIGSFPYDYLVIATGATTHYYGNQEIERHAIPMKSTVEALQLRYLLLENFEKALHAPDDITLQRYMNIAIVGGGPTGVELAGAIAEMRRYVLHKDYPDLDFSKMHIYLFEGSRYTLESMSELSSKRSMRYLERLQVTLKLNTLVTDYDGRQITTNQGEVIPANIVIWAAGIKGNLISGLNPQTIAGAYRLQTDAYHRIKGYAQIFAIGDIAFQESEEYPVGHPQIAPVAMQQADNLAWQLRQWAAGKNELRPFRYKNKGTMATIGRHLAVVDIPYPSLHLGGFPAWCFWMGLHLMLILGVKNRLFIFLNWLYSYLTYDQSLRLIFKNPPVVQNQG